MNHCSIFNSFGFSPINQMSRLTYRYIFMALCICSVVFLWKQIEIGENQKPKMMDQSKVQFSEEILALANHQPNFTNSQMNTLNIHAASDEFVFALHPAQVLVRSTSTRFITAMCAVMLTACGGGSGDTTSDTASLAKTTTVFTPKPATPAPVTPLNPGTPADGTASTLPIVAGALLTDFSIQNIGAAQTEIPFTFGQVIAQGQMNVKEGFAAKLPDGTLIRLQSDIKATHADGSVRHVVISGVLPALAPGQTQTLQLLKSSASQRSTETLQTLAKSGLTSKITVTLDGVKYTASLADALAADTSPRNWLSGSVANEWHLNAPLKNAAGVAQPLLAARFDVRWYSGLQKQARVDVVVENNKAFKAARNLTYDVDVEVAGRSVYAKSALEHYHHSRWHQAGWWDAARMPVINVKHNAVYLMATKAVSNYDARIVPPESALAELSTGETGPMTIGPLVSYMPMAGGRGDIGPLPTWSVTYLLSMDKRARDAMMAAADGSGTWPIHYRDENTGYPVRTDSEANKRITTHGNMSNQGPLPVPRYVPGAPSSTPMEADVAHQPSLAYLPYLVTGDYYYLEELQFWAAWNPLGTDPGNNGLGQGLVRWQQVRGQAWSLRTLGHSAYITPDDHPLKKYFTKQLDNNLEFYHATYVVGNPNKLGMYDGSGQYSASVQTSPPWQDDFLTWSFGYLSELGFTKATPILQWKAKYPVGRMTAPGYCWIQGAAYNLKIRDTPDSPIYDSFEKLYKVNYEGPVHYDDNGTAFVHPQGLRYIDQPCGSQAQVDFLTLVHHFQFEHKRMTGYADSTLGYPANMQPALAVAATSGVANAAQAWALFDSRSAKPPYQKSPQWAIIPR